MNRSGNTGNNSSSHIVMMWEGVFLCHGKLHCNLSMAPDRIFPVLTEYTFSQL